MSTSNSITRVATQTNARQKPTQGDCSAVFGVKCPEDVIAPIRVAQERLSWLEHLFNCIATDPQAGLRAQRLAEMGRFVALEASDLADCCHADMLEAIKKGGQHEHH